MKQDDGSLDGAMIFSDVDETLIRAKSMFEFVHWNIDRGGPWADLHAEALRQLAAMQQQGVDRVDLNRHYYGSVLSGLDVEAVRAAASQWFRAAAARPGFYKREVVEMVRGLQARGAKLVLVTGSFSELIEPIARVLDAHHALSAPVERRDGSFTGRLVASPTIGLGKAQAVRQYAEACGVALERCFGFGDDATDIPFLEIAGRVCVPSDGDPALVVRAKESGWTCIDVAAPRG